MSTSRRFADIATIAVLAASLIGVRLHADEGEAQARMRKDLTYLASDECEGRGVSTKGNALAAEYIADQFKKIGLKPAGKDGSYFQPFTITGSTLDGKPELHFEADKEGIKLVAGTDYEAFGMTASGKLDKLPIVFAGYGLTISNKDKEVVYDDYNGIDVKAKVVLILRGIFHDEDKEPPFALTQRQKLSVAALQQKFTAAEAKGAAAVLLVNDRVTATAKDGDKLMPFSMYASSKPSKIPIFQVTRKTADQLLSGGAGSGGTATDLAKLEKKIDEKLAPASFELSGWKIQGEVKTKSGIEARNVIGVLEGNGPLAKETIVIGCHYDHLGYGGRGSLAGVRNPAIHHGADDNGSGTTAVMELARRFAAMKEREGRRLVFCCFSGEELGLLGSKAYCEKPLFPLEDTAAMFNLDMVGRLSIEKDSKKERLLVQGVGTAKTFDDLMETVNKKYDFKLSKTATGHGPSDHDSFYTKKIPVLFCWTGDHEDYHKPTDTVDRINFNGMAKIVSMSEEIITTLATVKERPEYVRVKDSGGRGPRIGISFKDDAGEGAVVDAVVPHSPADDAGIKPNDRITAIAGKPVKNPDGFVAMFQESKAGEEVTLSIVRGDKKMDIKVVPVQLPVFGLRPDYDDDKNGLLLKGVAEGGAAEKSGLKAGDRIIEVNGQAIKDMQSYMDALYTVRPGKPVEFLVVREGKQVPIKVTPE